MLIDPAAASDAAFPYRLLGAVGITPASSLKDIKDASFELMARGLMTAEARDAWDLLRFPQRRLLVDFHLYPVDLAAAVAEALAALEQTPLETLWPVPADLGAYLEADPAELEAVMDEARDIPLARLGVTLPEGFDDDGAADGAQLIADDDLVRFDQ